MDVGGDIWQADMDQHHDGAQQQTRGIGKVLASATGSRAMNSLEHGKLLSNIGGACQTDRAGNLGSYVRENIAIEVWHHHHIEGFGGIGQFSRANIHNPALILDIRVFRGDLVEYFVEEAIGHLHNVVFNEAGDLLAIMAPGILEGITHDPLGTRTADQLQAFRHILRLAILNSSVGILFVLTNNYHVHSRVLGVDEGIIGDTWSYIGVEAKGDTGGNVEALVAATLRRRDRRFEKYFGAAQRFPGAGLHARANATQIDLLSNFNRLNLKWRACCLDNMEGSIHNFWTDTISVCNRYRYIFCHKGILSW